jgi:hypothetical protein
MLSCVSYLCWGMLETGKESGVDISTKGYPLSNLVSTPASSSQYSCLRYLLMNMWSWGFGLRTNICKASSREVQIQ